MELKNFFEQNKKVALCFSGGVDSSYLLYAGLAYGAKVQPYILKTEFQPEFELEDAKKLAQNLGVELIVHEASVLAQERVVQNDALRCYHCKSFGLGTLANRARLEGYDVIIDGSNFDDNPAERPGMRALEELKILSPLRMANLTKSEIRRLSEEAGLFTWDKPAYACLATRVPTGTRLEKEVLGRIEQSEKALFDMGFSDFRVRVMGKTAKLQLPQEQMAQAIHLRKEVVDKICFDEVVLDLVPR